MELEITNGDYVLCGGGGYTRLFGAEALLSRVMFRLSAKRGAFPLLPEMGSRLWLLPSRPRSMWQREAFDAVAEALKDEPVEVLSVTVAEEAGYLRVTANLIYDGTKLTAEVIAA